MVCGECGDLACGAVTASLQMDSDSVSWRDFLWEDGIAEPCPAAGAPEEITFSRDNYETTLYDAYDRVAALPYDEPTTNERKVLWPWRWGRRLPPRR